MKIWKSASNFHFLINVGLAIVTCSVSLLILDFGFAEYENYFLNQKATSIEPTADEVYDLATLHYNDHVGKISKTTKENEFRILSFGDSFAYSVVPPDKAYAAQLEFRLSSSLPKKQIRVVNFGGPAASFLEYITQFQFWASRLDYDAVIFNFYNGNDLSDLRRLPYSASAEGKFSSTSLFIGPGKWVPHAYPLRMLDYLVAYYHIYSPRLKNILPAKLSGAAIQKSNLFVNSAFATQISPTKMNSIPKQYLKVMRRSSWAYRTDKWNDVVNGYRWLNALIRLAKNVQASGKKVLIVISPSYLAFSKPLKQEVANLEQIEEKVLDPFLPGKWVSLMAENISFRGNVLDLTQCLGKMHGEGNISYFADFSNTHWTVKGNENVSNILADYILENWLSQERSKNNLSGCTNQMMSPLLFSPLEKNSLYSLLN